MIKPKGFQNIIPIINKRHQLMIKIWKDYYNQKQVYKTLAFHKNSGKKVLKKNPFN